MEQLIRDWAASLRATNRSIKTIETYTESASESTGVNGHQRDRPRLRQEPSASGS